MTTTKIINSNGNAHLTQYPQGSGNTTGTIQHSLFSDLNLEQLGTQSGAFNDGGKFIDIILLLQLHYGQIQ